MARIMTGTKQVHGIAMHSTKVDPNNVDHNMHKQLMGAKEEDDLEVGARLISRRGEP